MAAGMKRLAENGRRDDIVHLNVGGVSYDTRRSTLCSHEGPLQHMFNADGSFSGHVTTDRDDRSFIDRDGRAFACVLGFLRTGIATVPPGLSLVECQRELCYFFIDPPMVRNEALLALDKRPLLVVFLANLVQEVRNCVRRNKKTTFMHVGDISIIVEYTKFSSFLHEMRFFISDTASSGQRSADHWSTSPTIRAVVGQIHAEPLDERSIEFYLEKLDNEMCWSVRYERRLLEGQLGAMRAHFVHFSALYRGVVCADSTETAAPPTNE